MGAVDLMVPVIIIVTGQFPAFSRSCKYLFDESVIVETLNCLVVKAHNVLKWYSRRKV